MQIYGYTCTYIHAYIHTYIKIDGSIDRLQIFQNSRMEALCRLGLPWECPHLGAVGRFAVRLPEREVRV